MYRGRIRALALLAALALPLAACPDAARDMPGIHTDLVRLPEGFKIEVYHDDVPDARSMTLSPNGTLFVGTREDRVYALRDTDGDNRADQRYIIASGLNSPNGVAWRDGALYIAEISRIVRLDDIESRLDDPPQPAVVNDSYPTDRHHGWKFIAFGPDDMLYVPVGAPCNVCDPADERYSTITRIQPDGSGFEIYSHGIRNTVGFDWHPETKALWFTENGRDWMGDDQPPDELNAAAEPGLDFGFPHVHGYDIIDPQFGQGREPSEFTLPEIALDPHIAALGMRFYNGDQFPEEYRGQIFIAEHGSWNRDQPLGYRVMLVRFENGKAVSYEPFATGWLQGMRAWGRPVDVQVMPDGALLVSDDRAGAVYRITYGR